MKTKVIFFMVLVFFFSCEKEVEVFVHSSEPKHVIEALIEYNNFATVRIVQSKNFGEDNQYDPVQGAIVCISDDSGRSEILEMMPSGLYEAKEIRGIEGITYFLQVGIDDKKYFSQATMPSLVPINELIIQNTSMGAFPRIYYQDPAGIKNYYRTILSINGKSMPDNELMDDSDTDGKIKSHLILYNPDYNNGKEIKKGDRIKVEMHCLDKGTYIYFETLSRINSSLTNPTSNIVGGALGYFGVYISSSKEIIADW